MSTAALLYGNTSPALEPDGTAVLLYGNTSPVLGGSVAAAGLLLGDTQETPEVDWLPSYLFKYGKWLPTGPELLGHLRDVDTLAASASGVSVALVENPAWDPQNPDAAPRWVRGTVDATNGGPDLSNSNPLPDGTAAPGTSTEASRADHVHPAPVEPAHNDLTGRDAADAHPIAAITGLQAALDVALDVASTGGLVPVNVGTPTVDDTTMTVTFGSVWGIDADGTYYNAAGVTAGDAAGLFLDTTTGELTTIALETR